MAKAKIENPVKKYFRDHPQDKPYLLAGRAGLSAMAIYKIVNGKTRYILPVTMEKLVKGTAGAIKFADLTSWNMARAEFQ